MELMAWATKPFWNSMIWLGEAVDRYTIFGIKVFWIVMYVSILYTTNILASAIYQKGYNAGIKSVEVNNG